MYFFEKFYLDGEEITMRRSGLFWLVDNFLQAFKVQSEMEPLIVP